MQSRGHTVGAKYKLLPLEADSGTGLPVPPHPIPPAGSAVYPGKA